MHQISGTISGPGIVHIFNFFIVQIRDSMRKSLECRKSQAVTSNRRWSLWGRSGVVLGVFWGRSRVILGLFWGRSGLVLGLFWGCSGFEALV